MSEPANPASATAAANRKLPGRLANRNFLLLWQGQAVSQLGNQAFAVAMAFWIVEKTGSASLMGFVLMSSNLPGVLLGPLGGAVADRFPRIRIIILADLVAGLGLLGLSFAMLGTGWGTRTIIGLLFAASFTEGVARAFFLPALAAAIPDLVPAEKLAAANSMNQFSLQASLLLGQGVGGVLYRLLGAPVLFLADGLSFLFSAVSEGFVQLPPAPRKKAAIGGTVRQFATEIREGFEYMRGKRGLLGFVLSAACFNLFVMPVFVLLPFFVRNYLRVGADWYGFLLAAISAGVIVGFLLAGLLRLEGRERSRFVVGLMLLAPAPFLVTAFVRATLPALAISFVLGIVVGLINVYVMTVLQATTPSELRGRVMGLLNTLTGGLVPIGMAVGGVVGDLTGKNVPLVYTSCGLIILLSTLLAVGRRSTRDFLAYELPARVEGTPASGAEGGGAS